MATTVKLTNVQQMVGFLMTVGTNSMFLSCLTATPQDRYLTKNCPFKGVLKVARRDGWLNINYNSAVRRRIAKRLGVEFKDVEYTNGPCWHRHVTTEESKATPVCVNASKEDGKFYVFIAQGKVKGTKYVLPSGEQIPYDQLKPFFRPRAHQDELKPVVRIVTLNNVSELRARGLIVRTNTTDKHEALLNA